MARKKIILDLDDQRLKPTKPEGEGVILVRIAVEKLTSENVGYVLGQLRFYCYDARSGSFPGKYPFKIYESCYELGHSVKKKVAEFTTKRDMEEAFVKIKEAYIANFNERYELVEKPGLRKGTVKRRTTRNAPKGVRKVEDAALPEKLPVPAEQPPVSSRTEVAPPCVLLVDDGAKVGSEGPDREHVGRTSESERGNPPATSETPA